MNLSRHIFSYSMANIINSAVPFFLLPVLTSYLNPAEFGTLSLIQLLLTLALPFVLMNVHGLFMIEFSKLSREDFISFTSTMIWIPVLGFLALEVIFLFFSTYISNLFNIPEKWVLYTPIFVLFQSIPMMIPVLFQAKKQPLNYAFFKIALTIANFGISILLVVVFLEGWEGRIWGIFLSYLLFTVIGLFILYRLELLRLSISFTFMKSAMKFGLPLIPHTLAGVLLAMSDRIFLANMLGVEEVGIYSVAFQMGSMVTIIMSSINQAWVPHLYELLNNNPSFDDKEKIVIQTYKIMLLMTGITLVFILIIPFVFKMFIDVKYYSGINLSRLIAIAFLFQGFYFMVTNYIFYVKKTHLLSMLTISAAAVLMTLNYVMIPIYGMYGSAYAMITGYILWFILTFLIANKVYKMPWRLKNV